MVGVEVVSVSYDVLSRSCHLQRSFAPLSWNLGFFYSFVWWRFVWSIDRFVCLLGAWVSKDLFETISLAFALQGSVLEGLSLLFHGFKTHSVFPQKPRPTVFFPKKNDPKPEQSMSRPSPWTSEGTAESSQPTRGPAWGAPAKTNPSAAERGFGVALELPECGVCPAGIFECRKHRLQASLLIKYHQNLFKHHQTK